MFPGAILTLNLWEVCHQVKGLRRMQAMFNVLTGAVFGVFFARLKKGKIGDTAWIYLVLALSFFTVSVCLQWCLQSRRKRLPSDLNED